MGGKQVFLAPPVGAAPFQAGLGPGKEKLILDFGGREVAVAGQEGIP